jgi:hypothetical protein
MTDTYPVGPPSNPAPPPPPPPPAFASFIRRLRVRITGG